ncbi:MAG: helix-turn-helix transcriptional regulator [Rikenellaceae bacterium]
MKEKIVQLMKSEALTTSRLAEILEVQPSGISHIVSGRNKPGFDLLRKILKRFPQINPDWLLLDSPTMYRQDFEKSISENAEGVDLSPINLFDFGGVDSMDSSPIKGDNLGGFSAASKPQNQPQNGAISGAKRASVERIIILYSDGTFSTYNSGQ